jgi:hypothetical protein
MLAYHNDETIKTNILTQLAAHRAADEIVKGRYWEHGKGCAIGCTIYSGRHVEYETRFGVPQVLARLEDRIFEGLPNDVAMTWPERFISAIPVGADLAMVWPCFALWLLSEELPQHARGSDLCAAAIAAVAALYAEWCETGKAPSQDLWAEKRRAANVAYAAYAAYAANVADAAANANAAANAADAAYAAYAAAAYAAAYAAAAYAAANAAYAAAYVAANVADAAANVAYAAYAAANVAYAAANVANAANAADAANARRQSYVRMADKLVEIIAAILPSPPQ